MKISTIKPILIIQRTNKQLIDQGYTYNEPGITYNQVGIKYGGIGGYDISPLTSQAKEIKPN